MNGITFQIELFRKAYYHSFISNRFIGVLQCADIPQWTLFRWAKLLFLYSKPLRSTSRNRVENLIFHVADLSLRILNKLKISISTIEEKYLACTN